MKKDVKPERSVPLTLVSSADINACDLLCTGFVNMTMVKIFR